VQTSLTVVICAAGRGSRLDLGCPKSLVVINGRTLIEWQLRQLEQVKNLVIVVGYQGQEVAREVWKHRPDALIALNHEFANTGTAASLKVGAALAESRVVGIDGDLLISRQSLKPFLESNQTLIGIVESQSRDAHLVKYVRGCVEEFDTKEESNWEWSGPINVSKNECMDLGEKHVYQGLKSILPIPALPIEGIEIDYQSDIPRAEDWISRQNEF
jgi:choline kinase